MVRITLKKILAKKEGLSVVTDLIKEMGADIVIQDSEGKVIINGGRENKTNKYPVEVSGEIIGWVIGDEKASAIAKLILYLAKKELDKKALANEVLDKYREITLLHNISEKLTASIELKEVAFLVIDEARRLTKANSGSVIIRNEGTGKLEIISEFGKCANEKSLKLDELVFDTVVKTGKGEIVNDVLSDPRFVETQEQLSLIFVPLKTKNKVIGAIMLRIATANAISSTTPVNYTAEDLKILSMLALQAASAMENAILHENKLKESRRDALLFRLATQIHHSLDLDTILSTAVSEIRNLLQVDRCQFIWYRQNQTEDHALNSKSSYWEVVTEARNPEIPTLIGNYSAKEMGSFTQKILDRKLLRTSDVKTVKEPVMRQFFVAQGFTSLMALPIQTRSGALGAISCGNCNEVRHWSDFEVELLQAVGNQLAIALNQAELYEQSCITAATAQAQAQELQKALQELQHAQAQLIQSEKMSSLGQLVAGIAHEINNPVNFISGNITHAHQYVTDLLHLVHLYAKHYPQPVPEIQAEAEAVDLDFILEDLPKLISSMKLGANRITEIVLSLRNFSRLDESEMKEVDIHEGIDSTLLILESRLRSTKIRPAIQVIKEYHQLPLVECYPGQLNQVFMNIIANAIDALDNITPAGKNSQVEPTIQIRTDVVDNNSVLIRIRDNGHGMTEQVKAKLFDPFFTTKPVGKGTGLGMSISYKIVVEKHGGALTCFSQPGKGAEFWIKVPLQPYSKSQSKIKRQNGAVRAISIAR